MFNLFIIFDIAILVGLILLLKKTSKPFLCSGLFGLFSLGFNLIFGLPVGLAFFTAAIALAVSSLYFWLLKRFDSGWPYWLILVLGFVVCLVL